MGCSRCLSVQLQCSSPLSLLFFCLAVLSIIESIEIAKLYFSIVYFILQFHQYLLPVFLGSVFRGIHVYNCHLSDGLNFFHCDMIAISFILIVIMLSPLVMFFVFESNLSDVRIAVSSLSSWLFVADLFFCLVLSPYCVFENTACLL